jgi:hypothetical protein
MSVPEYVADTPAGDPGHLPDSEMTDARRYVRLGSRRLRVPASRSVRIASGTGLIAGGILGFLPVFGFWMLPLGLLILSVDLPPVRRYRRRIEVRYGRWRSDRRHDGSRAGKAASKKIDIGREPDRR